ncbi:MAG: hypothetical protein K2O97_03040 [Acetatifactor sp.]|nr:hypothetical protein [Acetatifactor sp.]
MIHTCGFALYSNLYARGLEGLGMEVVDSRMAAGEEEFLKELMSGSSEVDIYVVWDSRYWENHAYTDLSVSETLADRVEQMHKVLKDSAYHGDELAGIPVRVMGAVMARNQGSEGYPLVNERIADWDDLLVFLNEISSQYTIMANKAGLYQLLFAQYIYEYGDPLAGNVDFDTESFRKVLDIMKQIHDSPYFQEPGTGAMISYGADYDFRPTDVIGINHLVVTDQIGDPRRLPAIESDKVPAPQIRVAYAVVNPNSENREAAIRYFEMLVTGRAYLETAELFPLPGNDNLNAYMEDAMVFYDLDIYRTVSVDIDSWLKEQAGLDETVAVIQEKGDLFFREQEGIH